MAIKIKGKTIISDEQNLTLDGSGTFGVNCNVDADLAVQGDSYFTGTSTHYGDINLNTNANLTLGQGGAIEAPAAQFNTLESGTGTFSGDLTANCIDTGHGCKEITNGGQYAYQVIHGGGNRKWYQGGAYLNLTGATGHSEPEYFQESSSPSWQSTRLIAPYSGHLMKVVLRMSGTPGNSGFTFQPRKAANSWGDAVNSPTDWGSATSFTFSNPDGNAASATSITYGTPRAFDFGEALFFKVTTTAQAGTELYTTINASIVVRWEIT